jgi:hypothetical protein
MVLRNDTPDGGEDRFLVERPEGRPFYFDGQDQLFVIAILSGEGGAGCRTERRMTLLDARLDVLRIVIVSLDDNDVFKAPGHEEFTIPKEPKIPGTQEGTVKTAIQFLQLRLKCFIGSSRVLPITLSCARALHPNLPDLAGCAFSAVFGIDDAKVGVQPHFA